MTDLRQLQQIHAVLDARYQQQQQQFNLLTVREAALRADIKRLNQNLVEMHKDFLKDPNMRALGVDIAWQAWLERKKTNLNLELARILATKEHHLKQLRTAYGKVLAIEEITDRTLMNGKKKRAQDSLSRAISMKLLP